jgi:hypothetical protein
MQHANLLSTVEQSTINDWHKMPVHTVCTWQYGQKQNQNYLEPQTHSNLAVYKPDIGISIAMGATVTENFAEQWVQNYSNPTARSVAIWLRYHGAVVHEWVYVVVDGGRYLVPMPETDGSGGYHVQQTELSIAQLLFELHGVGGPHETVSDALQGSGVKIV